MVEKIGYESTQNEFLKNHFSDHDDWVDITYLYNENCVLYEDPTVCVEYGREYQINLKDPEDQTLFISSATGEGRHALYLLVRHNQLPRVSLPYKQREQMLYDFSKHVIRRHHSEEECNRMMRCIEAGIKAIISDSFFRLR